MSRLTWLGFVLLFWSIAFHFAIAKDVASVNGVPINTQHYYAHYQQLLKTHPNAVGQPKLEQRLEKRVILPLIKELLLRKEARRVGLNIDQITIKDPVETLKKKYKTEERLADYLRRTGETEATLRRKEWNNTIVYQLMNKAKLLFVSKEEVKVEYNRQLPVLRQAEQIKAYQVLIRLPKQPSSEEVNEAFKRAQKIHQLLMDGTSFAVCVQRYSEGPLRSRNGDMGFVRKGDMVRSVEDTIWQLKENEFSIPIRSKYGWHIIQRGRRIAPNQKDFKDVEDYLKEKLMKAKFRKIKRQFIKKLWETSKVKTPFSIRF